MNNFLFIFIFTFFILIKGQLYSASDRSPQELALLEWSSGLRMAYCQDMALTDLVDPFREALAKMANRHCRNATACHFVKPVQFTVHHVILLDGYPKRDHRAVIFRFFIVLPPDAIPTDKDLAKPLVHRRILADILRVQMTEFTHRLGWQILSFDKYPRFDPITTFMNRALIPIAVIAMIFMFFLAYWSATISSSSHSSEGWMVSGSTGGKNAALRRTLEIIEEQKYHQEQEKRLQMALERQKMLAGHQEMSVQHNVHDYGVSFDSTVTLSEVGDHVPEIVIVHARNSTDSIPMRKISHQSRNKGRRFSSHDDHKRKQRGSIFGGPRNSRHSDRRWKTGSLMLRSFSKDGK